MPPLATRSESNNFRYWDEAKLLEGEEMPPQTKKLQMKAHEYAKAVREPSSGSTVKHYLHPQDPLHP